MHGENITITANRIRPGTPVDLRWLRNRFFIQRLTLSFEHPTDPRFVCDYWFEVCVGNLKVRNPNEGLTHFPTRIRLIFLKGSIYIPPSVFLDAQDADTERQWWLQEQRERLRVHARYEMRNTPKWSLLGKINAWEILGARTGLDVKSGVWDLLHIVEHDTSGRPQPPQDHPALKWNELQTLCRDIQKGMPPALLIDWMREHVPVVESALSAPPLPPLASYKPFDPNAT